MPIPPLFVRRSRSWLLCCGLSLIALKAFAADAPETGLLFYLSGEQGTTADISLGKTPVPNFDMEVTSIPDGAKGKALSCADLQRLSYWAPGNIYAQRGTLSFFWRSRYPVGPTEFPIFRVGYADHSSWDMVWLRIDYNGHGFDAFVTDANLSRTRVSVEMQPFAKPNEWIHLAFSWDETRGIRFYVNGKLAASKETQAVYNTALDQFGPHSRIIAPWNVQSDYNFVRGGDIDELRIYDRMLADENVATLAKGDAVKGLAALPARVLADPSSRDEWALRYGWNRPGDLPPYYAGAAISIRKVEILEAYDLKRWWWKACDGMRETTWPGVYNRSRLPGRSDYFHLPDWDCYVESGKSITFIMPDEPWNHLEISGAAWGSMSLLNGDDANDAPARAQLFERPKAQEKTIHTFATSITGQKIRFTNVEQEQPIGELVAYNVTAGKEPTGSAKLAYRLGASTSAAKSLDPLVTFINGRYAPDERTMLIAQPAAGAAPVASVKTADALPIVHVLIPNESADKAYQLDSIQDGLDGIAIDLPALSLKPVASGLISLNIQVKDPLWPLRNMLDFTFSVKPGEAKTLWLDLRDRILPPGKALYLSIASASSEFGAASLVGAEVRLVFKPRVAAATEHEADRFAQARDSYAMLVEEHPRSVKFNLWNRFEADINDLIRVNPNHYPGRDYFEDGYSGKMTLRAHPVPPDGVPLWAFRQVELLGRVKAFVNWWVDDRQVAYGDFGGGISDDVDLVNMWPGMAFMGCNPEKLKQSDHALLEAAFKNGMFTNGLPTIQADELHSYEEGINCLGQNLILDFGNPQQLERAMATARGVESLTGINAAGHRHIRTSYYSGTRMALEEPWGRSKFYSYLVLQPGLLLVDYNGSPAVKKVVTELADSLLAHRHQEADGKYGLPSAIHYESDKDEEAARGTVPWPMFWASWSWTGDNKYLTPFKDGGLRSFMEINANTLDLVGLRKEFGPRIMDFDPNNGDRRERRGGAHEGRGSPRFTALAATPLNHFKWQVSGDKKYLEQLYTAQIEECQILEYIDTEGHLWSDRVGMPFTELQRARLGGAALVRGGTYSGNAVSWSFRAPANEQSLAILIPDATTTSFKVIAYNLDQLPVRAALTGWHIDPGVWEITQGIDTNGDDVANDSIQTRTIPFERTKSVDFTFPARTTTVLTFKLKTPGKPYWQRPDLGISREDVVVDGRTLHVKIHSLGSVEAPATMVVFRDASGHVIATTPVAALAAPIDLVPKTLDVNLTLPAGVSSAGGSVEIDPDHQVEEITELNNRVNL